MTPAQQFVALIEQYHGMFENYRYHHSEYRTAKVRLETAISALFSDAELTAAVDAAERVPVLPSVKPEPIPLSTLFPKRARWGIGLFVLGAAIFLWLVVR